MKPQVVIVTSRTQRIVVGVLVGSVLFVGGLIGLAFVVEGLPFRWGW